MKKFMLLWTVLFSLYCFSQNYNEINGWRDLKWGMPVDSIKSLLGNKIISAENTSAYKNEFYPFFMQDYEIDGKTYKINFLFTQDSHTLCRVMIEKDCGNSCNFIINSLEAILISKYGNPTFKSSKPYTSKWIFDKTTIDLNYLDFMGRVILNYRDAMLLDNKSKL
jgi:hypothetical protein